ncbi:SDR family NAD(P)-dependent oxidoreductase [Nocardioides daeguensis]|uniref:SDR family oxidoreductase n=1 Tax=Nocardioides daeguensis TaxID=908359 RepID=A0ABP6UZI6_9ACTN|nr:SDR family NAD(P)-dependent oxidoreductase [Nocardioides daeguensis]MBV6728762.1 SDR family oxidoreductase [Nocardioides daeguensis]MCR1773628.1 SDR family oxidoreductase [Nocardioides daeguensis]
MARLQGKTALITGATGGQGRVACRTFAEEGARVLATDLDPAAGAELEATLRDKGLEVTFVATNLASAAGVEELAAAAEALGGLDVLYANHGIILGSPLLETTEEEWDRIQDVNLKSVFLLTRRLAPVMADRDASIINVSSVGALTVFPNLSAYGAAKAGLAMFSKCAAVDLAPLGIRVNAICPGVIDTPMPRSFIDTLPDQPDAEPIMRAFAEGSVVGRLGRPEEVVSLALYLASDESTFMTGSVLTVDGGWSLT